jgi:molybdopterin converting factor small subunit
LCSNLFHLGAATLCSPTLRGDDMTITVEFFGIPRARAGTAATTAQGRCLGEVLSDLAGRFPEFARDCLDGNRLRPGFTANLRGERFVTDPQTPLAEGDTVLLLSVDAGG